MKRIVNGFVLIASTLCIFLTVGFATYYVPHFFFGPCALRGGYDRVNADFVICGDGERRAYNAKQDFFFDFKGFMGVSP